MSNKTLIKEIVCADCMSLDIIDINCVCTYMKNYKTIELEFEKCDCCGNIERYPAKTEFNDKQLQDE
jgi:RNase P subunit RPR2